MANLNIAIQIAAQDQASGPIGTIKNALGGLGDFAKSGFAGLQTVIGGAFLGAASVAVGAIGLIGSAAFGVSQDVQAANNLMVAQFGATADEAEHLGNIATDVWGNNFAGSIEEAANAVGLARQQLGDLSDQELQDAAENAFRLSDVFGEEVPSSIETVSTLMEEFGLTSDQAFDLMAKGMQDGLNANDDFIDSIGEYSNLFAEAGFGADEMYSIMQTGAAGGVLGTDKISDAIKEMLIRLNDAPNSVRDAFLEMEIDFDTLAESVAMGNTTWADHFDLIIEGMNEIQDPIMRSQVQVGIFGTMAEDLGASFTEGLSTSMTALGDMEGAAGSLDASYNNLSSMVEGYWRKIKLAIQPVGDVLLNMANSALPLVDSAFGFIEANVVPAIETAAGFIQTLFDNITAGQGPITALQNALTTAFGGEVATRVMEIVTGVQTFIDQATTALAPITAFVTQFVEWQDVLTALGLVVASIVLPALASIVIAAAPVIAVGAVLIAGIALVRNAWENDWGGIQGKVQAVIDFIVPFVSNAIASVQAFWAANGEAILAKATQIWQGISDFIGTAINFIVTTVTTIATNLQTFWQAHGDTILTTAETIWQTISDFVTGIWDTLTALFAAFKLAFEGDWTAFGENLRIAWDTAWDTILNLLASLWDLVRPILTNLITDVIDKFTSTDWGSIGRGIIDGIANAISNGIGSIVSAAQNAAQAALDAALGFLGISSPSRVAAEMIGTPFVQGITTGIVSEIAPARSAVTDAIRRIFDFPAIGGAALAGVPDRGIGRPQPLAAAAGGDTYIFNVDARGSSLTRADVEIAIRQALDRAGLAAEARRRTR